MHYVKIFVFAAALAMAACDSSAEPGDEPDSATTDTVSETGKGDSPYSRDTSFSDSDGEGLDTAAEPDTANTTTPETTIADTIAVDCPSSTLNDGDYCEIDKCWLTQYPAPGCEWKCANQGGNDVNWVMPASKAESHCLDNTQH